MNFEKTIKSDRPYILGRFESLLNDQVFTRFHSLKEVAGQPTGDVYNYISKVLQAGPEINNVFADSKNQTFFPQNKLETLIKIGPLAEAFSNFIKIVGYGCTEHVVFFEAVRFINIAEKFVMFHANTNQVNSRINLQDWSEFVNP